MIRRTRTVGFAAALWIGVPLALAAVPGCSLVQTNAHTDVADGKLYEPGEVEYDRFFKDLYEVQLLMGQGPEREQKERERIADSLGLPADKATAEGVGDAVYERAAVLTKSGTMLKLSLGGLDGDSAPSATVVTIGEVKEPRDKAFVDALDTALKADVQLLLDLRKARMPLEHLRGRAATLEPRIGTVFAKSRSKREEVRKNLDDARQLIPLMIARGDDLRRQTTHFLSQLQKVLGNPTSSEGPTPPPEKTPAKKPKGKKPEGKPVSKPSSPPRAIVPKSEAPKPVAEAKKPPPAEKKPAKPVQDFEP